LASDIGVAYSDAASLRGPVRGTKLRFLMNDLVHAISLSMKYLSAIGGNDRRGLRRLGPIKRASARRRQNIETQASRVYHHRQRIGIAFAICVSASESSEFRETTLRLSPPRTIIEAAAA